VPLAPLNVTASNRKMSKMSASETDVPERERFGDLFALSAILKASLKDAEYKIGERASTSLQYTPYGLEVYNNILRRLPDADPSTNSPRYALRVLLVTCLL
jgi:hypothetical protein